MLPLILITVMLSGCVAMHDQGVGLEKDSETNVDPYLWLEEVEGEKALSWVKGQNERTLAELKADPRFSQFESEALEIYEAQDRIAYVKIRGDHVYNFWQDENNIRGIWRRSPLEAYLEHAPQWEVLLDLDQLAISEGENWVYKAVTGLPPAYDRFLVELSRGGKDAVVVREFDVPSKQFIADGFTISEAKSTVSWISHDQVLVASDFGPGSMTKSGYASSIRLWNRGETLEDSKELTRVTEDDLAVWGWTQFSHNQNYILINKSKTFWSHEILLLDTLNSWSKLEIPTDADFQGIFDDKALMILRSDWQGHSAGSLVAKSLNDTVVDAIYSPDIQSAISEVNLTATHVLVTIQTDVIDRVEAYSWASDGWQSKMLDLPKGGVLSINGAAARRSNFFYLYEDLLTPITMGFFEDVNSMPILVQSAKPRFASDGLEVTQEFATSADGTQIPYFLVKQEGLPMDGQNPVLLYGYGGFEVSEKPQYRKTTGKLWLEKGGVFALANIRGGGEYGPAWHQAALKENRHRSYEDFIAIGEDLISKGITRSEKLGIMGGSGGGLLVGAVYTMRPDLFGAMVSQVPLLDMLRYHKLLAGASWMGEYGDPDDPTMGAYLKRYSPYHQIKRGTHYTRALFTTSTKDDRVHPGHARKMVARLIEQGHPVLYYENMEGGHAAGANLKQYATMAAIEYTYLHKALID